MDRELKTARTRSPWRTWAAVVAAGLAAATLTSVAAPAAAADDPVGLVGSALYVDPFSTTLEAAQQLAGQARSDAQLLGSIPSGSWITKGTPAEAETAVDAIVDRATARGELPLIVAYNLPFRDCAQYSAGGAADTASYFAWVDGVVAGIDGRPAAVILEPDGVGIIPHYTTLDGALEWCQPIELDAATATTERFAQLNGAVDRLKTGSATSVYLDGTGASWLNVGEISDRLIKAGVQRADGFFLNASNYQFTANSTAFGTWVSSCIEYATTIDTSPAAFGECGNQYWNGGPGNDWTGVAMTQYAEWSADAADPAANTAGVDSRYRSILNGAEPSTHFVIDTSRNGLGPWQYPADTYPAHEDWCNPPARGLGELPSADTGVPLVDAYLWIKVPGESDGRCFRGTSGPLDPERGIVDPEAGQWFVEQARELVSLAAPAIAPLTCHVDVTGTRLGKGFVAVVLLENRGTSAIDPWRLTWSFTGTQRVTGVLGGSFAQTGADVTVDAPKRLAKLAPGRKTILAITGIGAASEPWQFSLSGNACTSS